MFIICTSGVWKHDGNWWKVNTNNPKLIEGFIGIYHWEISCLDMVKQPHPQIWGSDHCKVSWCVITCTSGVWKQGDSQWKVDKIHPRFAEGSIFMHHWERSCLDMVNKSHTQKYEGQTTAIYTDGVLIICTSGVWKWDGSQWKVDMNHPKLVEGSIGMYCCKI